MTRLLFPGLLLAIAAFSGAQPATNWPVVLAKSAIVIDATSGKFLWSKDADTPRYPASTTKIMTSLLLLENKRPDDLIFAPLDVTKVGGSSLHLKPGESISVHDALYAMMLRSANDVCHSIAVQLSGSESSFADLMNARAREIGCTNTFFHNPNGLPDPLHKTTARDLALIAREAMRNETFRDAVKTQKYWINRSINQEDRLLINRNKWLFKDTSADGIKTGFTNDAGHTYVGSAVRNGFRVITVVLNTKNWQDDHKALLDWSFAHYTIGLKRREGEEIGALPVKGGTDAMVKIGAKGWTQLLQRKGAPFPLQVSWEGDSPPSAPIQAGQDLGFAVVTDADGYKTRVPVQALSTVPRASLFSTSTFANPTWYIVAGAMLCGAWVMRRRTRTA